MSKPSPAKLATPLLDVELLSLFPEIFDSFLRTSLVGKAIENGIVRVACTNPRDFASGRHRHVDDASYGGGPGMVLRPEPLAAAIESVEAARGRLMVRLVSDGKEAAYRVKLRTPSFSNLSLFEEASKGMMLTDALALLGSLDLVIPDIDR